jgi:transcriptional regulator with XRE-family HTH domain
MTSKTLDFADWLQAELQRRGWNQAELARRSGITSGQISRVLNREQGAGLETMRAVAQALDISLYDVFVRAGLLPAHAERDSLVQQLIDMLADLPRADQEEILELARLKVERTKRVSRERKERT